MDEVGLLAQVPLFYLLEPEHLRELAGKLAHRSYQRGDVIFQKGDSGTTMYVIKGGQVKVSTVSPQGAEVVLANLTDGDFFGELSLLDGSPRSATVTATATTHTLTLRRIDFLDIAHRRPELAVSMLAALSKRLRHTNVLLEDAFLLDLPARLAKRLLGLAKKEGLEAGGGPEIALTVTQRDLATATGASEESVGRILGLFQDKGLVSVGKQQVRILSRDGLRELAD
jgi:CRP-like cAMP-binding protein